MLGNSRYYSQISQLPDGRNLKNHDDHDTLITPRWKHIVVNTQDGPRGHCICLAQDLDLTTVDVP